MSPIRGEPEGSPEPASATSPALRFLAERGRLVRSRPAVLAGAIGARLSLFRAYALWPEFRAPMVGVDLGGRRPAEWLRALEAAGGRPRGAIGRVRDRLDAATWNALRAGGLLIGSPPGWLVAVCAQALGRELTRPSLALYSRTGAVLSKVLIFVFDRTAQEPQALVMAMPERAQAGRLRAEIEIIEALRGRLSHKPEVAAAMPPRPLLAKEVGGEYLVVVRPERLASATPSEDRAAALRWLERFQDATALAPESWGPGDERRELTMIREAWERLRPQSADEIQARALPLLGAVRGRMAPRCAVHGDFWHGNVIHRDGRMRVYDWEWAELEGTPFLDLWTYEFGELLGAAELGEDLTGPMRRALDRVRAELRRRRLDSGFAAATLAPSLARLAIRMRLETGRPGPAEGALAGMMGAAERLLLR